MEKNTLTLFHFMTSKRLRLVKRVALTLNLHVKAQTLTHLPILSLWRTFVNTMPGLSRTVPPNTAPYLFQLHHQLV